jgi:hypothetical protein
MPGEAERGSTIEFGAVLDEDLEDTIRQIVQMVKDEKFLQRMDIIGLAFILEKGQLKHIC